VRSSGPTEVTLTLADGVTATMNIDDGSLEVLACTWHPRFGVAVANQCVRVEFSDTSLNTCFRWADH
jgi:hypothetical protein